MKILALSGSLRAASNNTMLLRAVARLAPDDINVVVYPGLGDLPLFNPDTEFPHPPAVAALKAAINSADALLIASPEYAHGVTGVIKNALDWMVGTEAFVQKPVAVLNAAPRARHADEALRETLSVMSARLIESACITIPIMGAGLTEDDVAHHSSLSVLLVGALCNIRAALKDDSEQRNPE
jgi:chromate reductase